jgi:EmrB/QacA subfamily drug resistance transporter
VAEKQESALYRWTVLMIVMLGTFMAILDSSIVNVALPHMMSAFGVNRDQIEWVTTGFMLASATVMPLMGWLPNRLGYKTLYLSCLGLFTLASGLCALSWSLESLIAARILQAVGGGAIQPIGMSIVSELFEPHERGKALGIWGMGAVVAPALGPTVGGYLTDNFTWRSIFSVNIPIGVITLVIGLIIMREHYVKTRTIPFDLWGFIFLSITLIAGLTALSNGEEKGWDSNYIRICEAMSLSGLALFVGVELGSENPIVDLRLFLVRNFTISALLSIFRSIGLFGSVFLLPIFLQRLMGFPTVKAGIWMIPNAVAVAVSMPIAGRLADKYSPSILSAFGLVMVGSSLLIFGELDPLSSWQMIVIPQLIRGTGLAFLMSPLITAAINSVPQHRIAMATSFLGVTMNVGGSIGIALLNNYVTRSIHWHAVRLGEAFPSQSQAMTRFAPLASKVLVRHAPGVYVSQSTIPMSAAAQVIGQRAQVLGFENGFVYAGILLLCALPLCLLFKPLPHHKGGSKDEPVPIIE